ncbi:D-alanine--D-alanine ligase [Patescibacteria group bacterium]|nr:D-alanine--D-alanine ligase [Patescibacteria group bacterium]
MNGTVVGVLRGGPSREHEISLMTGHAVISNLSRERFTVRDIYIDKQGQWYERGKVSTPADILRALDVVVIALHGEYGEDGEVQRLLERFNIPYTGSNSLASHFAMHKVWSKEKAKELGLRTPNYRFIEQGNDVDAATYEIIRTFHQPVIVKPVNWGSSVGISIVGGYAPVYHAISDLLAESGGVLVEEFIRGTEATTAVVENLRGESLYTLPSIEIVPPPNDYFSYESKYNGTTNEICPGRFSKKIADELSQNARIMHEALGLRHYSRSDFMVTPRGTYYLETNTLPGLTKESLLPKSLQAVGIPFPDFLSHIVDLAMNK